MIIEGLPFRAIQLLTRTRGTADKVIITAEMQRQANYDIAVNRLPIGTDDSDACKCCGGGERLVAGGGQQDIRGKFVLSTIICSAGYPSFCKRPHLAAPIKCTTGLKCVAIRPHQIPIEFENLFRLDNLIVIRNDGKQINSWIRHERECLARF